MERLSDSNNNANTNSTIKPDESGIPSSGRKRLRLSEKMRICVRRHMLKKHGYLVPLVLCFGCIIALLLASFFPIRTVPQPKASDYPNLGVQLSFVGDVMLSRYIGEYGDTYGYDGFFNQASPIWANSDYTFANLECSVVMRDPSEYVKDKKEIHLAANPNSVQAMLANGINAINCANNHSHDYGTDAFREALAYFDSIGLNYSGTTFRYDERGERLLSTQLITENQQRIGFIGVTNVIYEGLNANSGVLTSGNFSLYTAVYEAHAYNDLTIVYVHWGKEYTTNPTDSQKELAHRLIDAGADIIIGSHSHCLQPVEKYGNGIIFYSLGNFVMDQINTFTRDSVIVQYNQSNDGSRFFELIPISVNDGVPQAIESGYRCTRIRKILTKYLDSTDYSVNDKGHIIIRF